jgi:hypothetical protein
VQFRVNPGFASSPWTGPVHGIYNTAFSGTINIDYVAIGTNCAIALPVQLLSFSGAVQNQNVLLEWITSSELNVNHFEIQKIENGNITTIGQHTAKGNQGSVTSYNFTDLNPGASINYYRIMTVDNDGNVTYSDVISVTIENGSFRVSLFPNPSGNKFELSLSGNSAYHLQVRTIEGSILEEKIIESGNTTAVVGENLPAGIYFVSVTDGTNTRVLKAIKY